MSEEDNDRSKPLSIDEIVAEQKTKPVKPKGFLWLSDSSRQHRHLTAQGLPASVQR